MSGYNYSNYNRIPFSGTYGGYAPTSSVSADQAKVNAALTNYNNQWIQSAQSNSFSTTPGLRQAQAELDAANAQLQADKTSEYAMTRTIGSSLVQATPIANFQEKTWSGVSNALDAFTNQPPSYSYPSSSSTMAPIFVPSPYIYDSSNASAPYSAPGSQNNIQPQTTSSGYGYGNTSNSLSSGDNAFSNSGNYVGSGYNSYQPTSNQGYSVNTPVIDSSGFGTMRADSAVDKKDVKDNSQVTSAGYAPYSNSSETGYVPYSDNSINYTPYGNVNTNGSNNRTPRIPITPAPQPQTTAQSKSKYVPELPKFSAIPLQTYVKYQ